MAKSPESINDHLNQWLANHQEIKGALELGDTVIDTINKVDGYVGTAVSVLKLMGVFGEEKNPFEELYKALNARMTDIINLINDDDFLNHMKDIEKELNEAETFAQQAKKYIDNGRPSNESMDNEYDFTHKALNQLMAYEGTYWTHTRDERIVGEIPPPAGAFVWDYRVALPAALKALTAWFVVVEAIDPDYKVSGSYNEEIERYSNDLKEIHKNITQNITARKLASVRGDEEFWVQNSPIVMDSKIMISDFLKSPYSIYPHFKDIYEIPLHIISIKHLNSVLVRCGAIDVWSGTSTISDWHPFGKRPVSQDELDQMLTKIDTVYTYFHYFAKETRKHWLALYDDLGLNALANTVINLKALAQDVAIPNPKSLREMAGGLSLRELLSKMEVNFTLRQLALKEHLFSYVEETLDQLLEFEELRYG